jgi:hypothetical protein
MFFYIGEIKRNNGSDIEGDIVPSLLSLATLDGKTEIEMILIA